MSAGLGFFDAEGVWRYGEDDLGTGLASDLLNIHSDSVSDQFTLDRARLTALELGVFHVREEQAAGTLGGTFTSGAWQKRTLNTTKLNTITGASISGSVISLPAGTYDVDADAPAYFVNHHKAKLRDTTHALDLVMGSTEYSGAATSGANTKSRVRGRFTLAGTTNIELQHRCATTQASSGYGTSASFAAITGPPAHVAAVEVFSDIRFKRVS